LVSEKKIPGNKGIKEQRNKGILLLKNKGNKGIREF